jgi:hypothetical protein
MVGDWQLQDTSLFSGAAIQHEQFFKGQVCRQHATEIGQPCSSLGLCELNCQGHVEKKSSYNLLAAISSIQPSMVQTFILLLNQ